MSIFSTPTRNRGSSGTTYTSGGSAAGEAAGVKGLNEYWGMMDPTAYTGNVPGAGGPNEAQTKQYNMLTGMQETIPGAVSGAVGAMSPDEIAAMNRSGGPAEGYFSPFRDKMKGFMQDDYGDALAMMKNRVGAGASGNNAFGSTRHGAAEGVGGAKAQDDYLRALTAMDTQAFENAMQWQHQDTIENRNRVTANNQANLGFGDLRRRTAVDDINSQFGLTDRFGNYGYNQQSQDNLADAFNYGEFNRQQNWKPAMMDRYMAGVRGNPWLTDTTSTSNTSESGQGGKSPFDKAVGYAGTAAGMYLAYKGYTAGGGGTCIPKGTTIDMADGNRTPIEKIEPGDLVIGMDGKEVEVQQVHQYKQIPHAKFVTITFDNGSKVNCSHDHMINNKRARDYTYHDKINSRKVSSIVFYMGVERSYDLITTTGGYRIEGIPVNTMIPEMAEKSIALANKLMKAA